MAKLKSGVYWENAGTDEHPFDMICELWVEGEKETEQPIRYSDYPEESKLYTTQYGIRQAIVDWKSGEKVGSTASEKFDFIINRNQMLLDGEVKNERTSRKAGLTKQDVINRLKNEDGTWNADLVNGFRAIFPEKWAEFGIETDVPETT